MWCTWKSRNYTRPHQININAQALHTNLELCDVSDLNMLGKILQKDDRMIASPEQGYTIGHRDGFDNLRSCCLCRCILEVQENTRIYRRRGDMLKTALKETNALS